MDSVNSLSAWFRALKTVQVNESTRLVHCRVIDCPKRFLDEATALEHYKTHLKLFRCSECSDLYCSKQGVYDHFEEKHVTVKKKKMKMEGEAPKVEAPKVSNVPEKTKVRPTLPIDASTTATLSDGSID